MINSRETAPTPSQVSNSRGRGLPALYLGGAFLLIAGSVWWAGNQLLGGGLIPVGDQESALPPPESMPENEAALIVVGESEILRLEGEPNIFQLDLYAITDDEGRPLGPIRLGFRTSELDLVRILADGWSRLVEDGAFDGTISVITTLRGTSYSAPEDACSISDATANVVPIVGYPFGSPSREYALTGNLEVSGLLKCSGLSAFGDPSRRIDFEMSFRRVVEVLAQQSG